MINVLWWKGEDGYFVKKTITFDPVEGETTTEETTPIQLRMTALEGEDMQLGFQEGSYKVYTSYTGNPVVNVDYLRFKGVDYVIKKVVKREGFQIWEVRENE